MFTVSRGQAVFQRLAQDGGVLVPHYIPDVSDKWHKWKVEPQPNFVNRD